MKIDKSDLQLESLVSRIEAKEIDLQPDFQRGEIWDAKRRQRLIDTILRGWYVPAIHIVVDSSGGEVVLDGQQRLAAIRDFFADGIRIDGSIDPPNEKVIQMDGLRFSGLPEDVQRAVKRFVLQVITLSDYEPQEPNELFFRLNQSYNLTPPEKRNALHGEARDQVKALVQELIEVGLLESQRIGFGNGRLAYDDIVARVCVAVHAQTLRSHINNKVVEEHYRSSPFAHELIADVRVAGQCLLDQIEAGGGRVKMNKGTLQTWLVYCYWAPRSTGGLPEDLLREFDRDRSELRRVGDTGKTDWRVTELIRLYDDRASYRVTDVSSVLARDLAVHLYSQLVFGSPAIRESDELLRQLERASPSGAQGLIFDFMEASRWGEPIVAQQAAP